MVFTTDTLRRFLVTLFLILTFTSVLQAKPFGKILSATALNNHEGATSLSIRPRGLFVKHKNTTANNIIDIARERILEYSEFGLQFGSNARDSASRALLNFAEQMQSIAAFQKEVLGASVRFYYGALRAEFYAVKRLLTWEGIQEAVEFVKEFYESGLSGFFKATLQGVAGAVVAIVVNGLPNDGGRRNIP
ncbi:MAG: hypothetical protein Q9170_004401 [Blastenia crenularia]